MKCEEAKSKISFLPKSELLFDEKQIVLNHLRNCSLCKKEYQEYLRMFYLIDKQIDISVPENISDDFSTGIMKKVKNSEPHKITINKIIWYAAAAVFIILLLIPFFQINESQIKFIHKSKSTSITELIQNEEWNNILQKFEEKNLPEESIPVALLVDKLNTIDINLANNIISRRLGKNSNKLSDLIQLLNKYQQYKRKISTTTISEYLNS